MKRRRRVEIRVERHELSIFAGPSSPSNPANPSPSSRQPVYEPPLDRSGLQPIKPESCPICGSIDMLLLFEAIALTSMHPTSLKEGLESGQYHLHCSRAGEWWVCGQSLQTG
jgi:hypothetical protein